MAFEQVDSICDIIKKKVGFWAKRLQGTFILTTDDREKSVERESPKKPNLDSADKEKATQNVENKTKRTKQKTSHDKRKSHNSPETTAEKKKSEKYVEVKDLKKHTKVRKDYFEVIAKSDKNRIQSKVEKSSSIDCIQLTHSEGLIIFKDGRTCRLVKSNSNVSNTTFENKKDTQRTKSEDYKPSVKARKSNNDTDHSTLKEKTEENNKKKSGTSKSVTFDPSIIGKSLERHKRQNKNKSVTMQCHETRKLEGILKHRNKIDFDKKEETFKPEQAVEYPHFQGDNIRVHNPHVSDRASAMELQQKKTYNLFYDGNKVEPRQNVKNDENLHYRSNSIGESKNYINKQGTKKADKCEMINTKRESEQQRTNSQNNNYLEEASDTFKGEALAPMNTLQKTDSSKNIAPCILESESMQKPENKLFDQSITGCEKLNQSKGCSWMINPRKILQNVFTIPHSFVISCSYSTMRHEDGNNNIGSLGSKQGENIVTLHQYETIEKRCNYSTLRLP